MEAKNEKSLKRKLSLIETERKSPSKGMKNRTRSSTCTRHSLFSTKSTVDAQIDIKGIVKKLKIDNMDAEQYIPSKIDTPEIVEVKKVNLLQEFGGRGLFATQDIPYGTCLGIYTGLSYSVEEFDQQVERGELNRDYAMSVGGAIVDAAQSGNFTRYINFSDTQDNMAFIVGKLNGKEVVRVVAQRDIKSGEQLLINYNTYSEVCSKEYFFLNAVDSNISATQLRKKYQQHYDLLQLNVAVNGFAVAKGDYYYMTSIGLAILNHQALSALEEDWHSDAINLPFLKAKSSGDVFAYHEVDAFTPLMLASYYGQLANVRWLVEHGALVNQQQHHSGNHALFMALQGYEHKSGKAKCLEVMHFLITCQANVFAHDRGDNIFIHKAINAMSLSDFKKTMQLIRKQEHIDFNALFYYVNEHDFDLVTFCLKGKKLEKLELLLSLYPDYFKENYQSSNKEKNSFNKEAFIKAIADYDQDERAQIHSLLSRIDSMSNNLLSALEVQSYSSPSLR